MTDLKNEKQKRLRQYFSRVVILVLGLFIMAGSVVFAQNITVKGKVTDSQTKEGIPGANVVVKGTTNGVISNFDGEYSINVPSNGTLSVSFIGYAAQDVQVNGRTSLDVSLVTESQEIDEVVAIGYGTVKKRDITGSVASVKGDDLRAIPVSSAAEAITGKLAGVQITATEGSPDAEIKIRVRGGGSITQDNSPLYIVDGFPVSSISQISPSEIQSIDVLKDASSTAIYGSRGANGVIIITTKSGQAGKVSVSYNSYYSLKRMANKLDVLDPEDYVNWQYEYAVLRYGAEKLDTYTKFFGPYQDMDLFAGQPMNNWQEQIYGRLGEVFNHDLGVRGGTDKFSYSFNYAHLNDKAIMIGSDFKRDNLSFKMNHKANEKVQLAFTMRYSDTEINGGGANEQNEASSADSRLKHSVTYTPMPMSGLTDDGVDEDIASYLQNPITATYDNDRVQKRKNYNLAGSFSWEAFENMFFKSDVGMDNNTSSDNRFYGLTTYYINNAPSSENQGHPAIILRNSIQERIRNTNTLNYDLKEFLNDDHTAKLLLGQEYVLTKSQETTSVVHGFPKLFTSKEAFRLTNQGVANSVADFYSPDDKLLSFFGRLNYDYKSKYILAATFRADGSSKFSEGNRWGYFPSAALAWRISGEEFMQSGASWLDDLKLRLSYGSAGNDRIPAGQMSQTFVSSSSTWMNGFDSYWAASKTMANPDLKWETTYTRNLGLDFALFKSCLSGSFETYFNTTKGLLMAFPVSGTGYDTQYRNMGETQNSGFEVVLNSSVINKKNFGLNLSFNIGFNKNKINSLGIMDDFGAETGWASTDIGTDYWIAEGGSVGKMYGYVSDGRYEVSDFDRYDATTSKWILKEGVADATAVVGTLRPGTMKLKNLVGETSAVNIDDRTIIGDANPLHTGGFTINAFLYGFDLTAVLNWSYGNDIYNANKVEYTQSSPRYQYRNMISMMGNGERWTNIDQATGRLVNDGATLSGMNAGTTLWSPYMARFVFTDWAVEDGSFIRLNTLSLGYTIPSALTQKLNIQSLRFYVTGNNVAILTNYSGFDPEVSTRRKSNLTPGVDYSAYPKSRQLVFGLNLNF
ncbi:MAG: SusC/RagA family protein [Bacteroidetes bacterium GWB2_41_8]|nr:MAG: SusC/RagA family protein [Bacteroidetes bacterium GWB2_41_8]